MGITVVWKRISQLLKTNGV